MTKKQVAKIPEVIELLPMTADDSKRLKELEAVIKDNFIGFYKVGCALREISESKLYRGTHERFNDYCKDLWDIHKTRAYQLIDASKLIDDLSTMVDKVPDNERQVRPLILIKDPEKQAIAWKKVLESAPDGKITARHVESVVREIRGDSVRREFKNLKKKSYEAEVSFEFKQAYSQFVAVLEEEKRRCKGKKKLENEVIRMLDGLELVFREAA